MKKSTTTIIIHSDDDDDVKGVLHEKLTTDVEQRVLSGKEVRPAELDAFRLSRLGWHKVPDAFPLDAGIGDYVGVETDKLIKTRAGRRRCAASNSVTRAAPPVPTGAKRIIGAVKVPGHFTGVMAVLDLDGAVEVKTVDSLRTPSALDATPDEVSAFDIVCRVLHGQAPNSPWRHAQPTHRVVQTRAQQTARSCPLWSLANADALLCGDELPASADEARARLAG